MASYSNEYSNFPQEVITLHKYRNVTDSDASVVNRVNALRASGQYDQAQILMAQNADIFKSINVGAEQLNALFEEVYNAQVFAKALETAGQVIFTDATEPDNAVVNDVWIGGE